MIGDVCVAHAAPHVRDRHLAAEPQTRENLSALLQTKFYTGECVFQIKNEPVTVNNCAQVSKLYEYMLKN